MYIPPPPENINMSYTVVRVIDIIENDRPKPRSCVKFPCGNCNKSGKNNHKATQCDSCDLWIQIVCNDISDAEYECLKTEDDPWYNVPSTRCDNSELNNINTSNSMSFLESLPNVEIVNEASQFSNVSLNEASMEIPSKSCSNYYSVEYFKLLNIPQKFNIFHTNINGLESKLDNLYEFISGTSNKIDIIALAEISEKEDNGFIGNVEIDGYQKFYTASHKLSCTWIEIKNNRSKNIAIASICRHSHNNFNEFLQYLLTQAVKENKEL